MPGWCSQRRGLEGGGRVEKQPHATEHGQGGGAGVRGGLHSHISDAAGSGAGACSATSTSRAQRLAHRLAAQANPNAREQNCKTTPAVARGSPTMAVIVEPAAGQLASAYLSPSTTLIGPSRPRGAGGGEGGMGGCRLEKPAGPAWSSMGHPSTVWPQFGNPADPKARRTLARSGGGCFG